MTQDNRITSKRSVKTKTVHFDQKQAVGILISIVGLVLFGVAILGISIYGLDPKEDQLIALEIFNVNSNTAPAFYKVSLPANTSLTLNDDSSVQIHIDTQGKDIRTADLILEYNPSLISVGAITPGTIFSNYSQLKTTNQVKISGYFDSQNLTQVVNGYHLFATIQVTPLSTQSSVIRVVCQSDSTSDSNITYQGVDLINCQANQALTLQNIATQSANTNTNTNSNTNTSSQNNSTNSNSNSQGTGGNPGVACRAAAPSPATNIVANPGDNNGEVSLQWQKSNGATHYSIKYGTRWLDFDYEVSDTGDTSNYDIHGLKTGTIYYFVIVAHNGCARSNYSEGRASYAGFGSSSGNNSSQSSSSTAADGTTQTNDYSWTYQSSDGEKGSQKPADQASDVTNDIEIADDSTTSAYSKIVLKQEEQLPKSSPITEESETDTEVSLFDNLLKYLPWVGFGILALVIALLILYVRRRRTEFDDIETSMDTTTSKPIETKKDSDSEPQGFVFPEGWNK